MSTAADDIRKALDEVRVVDPHTHLRAAKPSADTLADIVLYHHVWIELVSAGAEPTALSTTGLPHEVADPGLPPLERVRHALPHLAHIRNTTLGLYLRWLLQDLYGLDGDLTDANVEQLAQLVEERGRRREWIDEVLVDRCGIERSITVEWHSEPFSDAIARGREWAPVNLVRGKQTPSQFLASCEKDYGHAIRTAADYAGYLARGVEKLPTDQLRLLGVWIDARIAVEPVTDGQVDAILTKVRRQDTLDAGEIGRFCRFGVTRLFERLQRTPLRTVHLLVGADVLPPHRSVTQWHGNVAGALGRLAGRFEGLHVMVSPASDAFTQDVGIVAKHVPNVSVAAYWWHVLYPFYIRKAVETRIDMVPMTKIVAYFSDAYHCEWCYPKLRMVKEIWGDVLAERVAKGWMTVATAIDVIRHAFYENPRRICFGDSSR